MVIRDILQLKSGEIFSISPDQPVVDGIALMAERGIGSVVILSHGKMVGLITRRDLLRALHEKGCDLRSLKISEIMVTDPIIGSPEDTVDYVRGVMTDNHISHLPVMENDQLLGIISFHDVAKACLSEANFENRLLKRYIKHWPE